MANNSALINYITSVIRSNGNQEITGDILQGVLLNIVNRLGYQFAGIAIPTTEPPLYPDANIWYLASASGTYTNFNGATLDGNTLVAFLWDGEWSNYTLLISGSGGGGGTSEVTAEWVTTQITNALFPYATKGWVTEQGYLTSFTSGDIIAALGYTPLPNTTNYALGDAVGGNAINANKLGGNLPSYYAAASVVSALATRVNAVEGNITTLNGRVTSIEDILADWFEFDAENNILYLRKNGETARHFISYGDIIAGGYAEGEDPSTLTTIGELVNVADNADDIYSIDKVLIKLANSTEWTLADLSSLVGLDETALLAYLTTNGYAKKSDIDTAIANLINGAPSTLDTLKEIADAFEQSQDVIEALDAAIGTKANQSDLETLAGRVTTNESSITNLSSYFTDGNANNALKLGGQLPAYYATAANLTNVSNRVTTLESIIGIDDDGNIYIKRDDNGNARVFYNYGDIVAGGYAEGGETPTTGIDWSALAAATTEQINISHLTDALSNYVTSSTLSNYLLKSELSTISVGNADTVDGYHASDLVKTISVNTDDFLNYTKRARFQTSYISGEGDFCSLVIPTWQGNNSGTWYLTEIRFGLGETPKIRWSDSGTVTAGWKTIAFTDSNVASATKLQDNTTFTAWGQTFFEGGKPKSVNGDITIMSYKATFGEGIGIVFQESARGYLGYIKGIYDDVDWSSSNPAAGSLRFYTASYASPTEKMRITSSGNVLIGTKSDGGSKLQVSGNIDSWKAGDYSGVIGLNRKASTGGRYNTDFNGWQVHNYKGDLQFFVERTAGGEVVYHIEGSTGNVGIGTIYPQYKLDVNGTLNATTIYQNGTTLDNTYLKLSGGTISGTLKMASLGGTYSYDIAFYSPNKSGSLGIKGDLLKWSFDGVENTLIHSGNIDFYNAGSATKLQTARTIWGQSFDGTGNVSGNLDLSYSKVFWGNDSDNFYIGITSDKSFNYVNYTGHHFYTYGYRRLTIAQNGNVLIGTTYDKGFRFQVSGNSAWTGYFLSNNTEVSLAHNDGYGLAIGSKTASSSRYLLSVNYNQTTLGSGGNSALYVRGDGNVGIGTTSPSSKLDVNGNARISFGASSDSISDSVGLRITRESVASIDAYGSGLALVAYQGKGIVINGGGYGGQVHYYNGSSSTRICQYNASYDLLYIDKNISSTGNITASGEITAGSDIRYKSIQNDVILDIRAIANAPIFDFRWTDREDDKLHLGTSAQYWLDYAPNAVTNSNDFYSLNYGVLGVAIGVSNAKKLLSHEERIEQLERENKQLRNELNQLRYGIE